MDIKTNEKPPPVSLKPPSVEQVSHRKLPKTTKKMFPDKPVANKSYTTTTKQKLPFAAPTSSLKSSTFGTVFKK